MSSHNIKISFPKNLLRWSKKNDRNFPWKQTTDPYKIWLSEIILQQTRVEQGTPYYLKMIALFPTVEHLAKAKEDAVLKAWQGLGYYSRARNLHSAAKYIVDELKGKFPVDYNGWLILKGVGPYAAAAIVSFAYNLPHAVVDGNVYRVLARCFGIETPIDSTEGKKRFSILANELLKKKDAGRFNQAIMDLGATICKPSSPLCNACPIGKNCFAKKNSLISSLPVKNKKVKIKPRFFHYMIAHSEKGFLFEKRTGNDIWKGLYQFPLIEATKFLTPLQLSSHQIIKNISSSTKIKIIESLMSKQLLSHQKIEAKFFILHAKKINTEKYIVEKKKHIKNLAVPKIIDQYIKNFIH